jgi:hypothetical protein
MRLPFYGLKPPEITNTKADFLWQTNLSYTCRNPLQVKNLNSAILYLHRQRKIGQGKK